MFNYAICICPISWLDTEICAKTILCTFRQRSSIWRNRNNVLWFWHHGLKQKQSNGRHCKLPHIRHISVDNNESLCHTWSYYMTVLPARRTSMPAPLNLTRVQRKGQVTIPHEIRLRLGLQALR